MSRASLVLCSLALLAPPSGCTREKARTTSPDEAREVDPLAELASIPVAVQAELDRVLQPIQDVDVVIDEIASLPRALDVDAAALRRLAAVSLASGEVAVSLDLAPDAKAEVEAVLGRIRGIVTGLRATPARAKAASAAIAALGTRATGLVSMLTAERRAALSDPRLTAEARTRLQAELDTALALDADVEATVSRAKTSVASLPGQGEAALVELTTAFSGPAPADAG